MSHDGCGGVGINVSVIVKFVGTFVRTDVAIMSMLMCFKKMLLLTQKVRVMAVVLMRMKACEVPFTSLMQRLRRFHDLLCSKQAFWRSEEL